MSAQPTDRNYSFKQIALQYACVHDKAVFRLNGKVPLKGSNGFKDATRDAEQINHQWDATPNANIGLPTGADNDLYVIDFDCGKGGQDLVARFEGKYGPLPTTRVVRTGSGFHHWFRYPGGMLRNTASKLLEYVDTRGEGGYVLAPGSLHPNGKYYEIVDRAAPIADLPEHLIKALENESKSSSKHPDTRDGVIPDGQRNAALTSYAGGMRRTGMTAEEIEAALQVINSGRCQPPMAVGDVRKIAESVSRYAPEHDLSAVDFEVEEGKKTHRAARRTSDVFEAFNALLPPDLCPPDIANTFRILLGKSRGLLPGEELFFTDFEGGMLLPGDPEADDNSVSKRWKRAIVEADDWQKNDFGKRCFKRTPGTNRFIGGKTGRASTYEVNLLEAVVEVVQIANGNRKPEVFAGHKKKLKRAKRFAIAAEYVRANVLPEYDPEPETQKVKGANTRKPSLVGKESRAMDRCMRAFAQLVDKAAEKGDSDVVVLVERTKHRMAELLAEKGFEAMVQLLVDPALIENETPEPAFLPDALSTHDKDTAGQIVTGQEIENGPDFGNVKNRFSENGNLQEINELPENEVDSLVQLHECEKVIQSWLDNAPQIGASLREIRDDQLYKDEFPTFEAFCEGQGMPASEVHELMLASAQSEDEVIELLERESIRLEGCNEPLDDVTRLTSATAA